MDLLLREVPTERLVVAIDPGKVSNRVWLTTGERGLIGDPMSLPVLRDGVEGAARRIAATGVHGPPVIGIEATGALHRAWAIEVARRWPGSLRAFAPSETQAARAQLGTRGFKTDDRDCAALVWVLRQGAGRPAPSSPIDALLAAVRHRRQLVDARRVLQQRLHDQLNALCAGLSAPAGHGRVLELEDASGRAVWRARSRSPADGRPCDHWSRLAPATYQSASVTGRGRISRQGLAEHRDALMGIAWGLAQHSPAFRERDREYRARGFRPI